MTENTENQGTAQTDDEQKGHAIVDALHALSQVMPPETFVRRCWKCGGGGVTQLTPIYHEILPFVDGICWGCDDPNPNDPEAKPTGKSLLGKWEITPEEALHHLEHMLQSGTGESSFVEHHIEKDDLHAARNEMVEDVTEMIVLVKARVDAGLPWVLIPGRNL